MSPTPPTLHLLCGKIAAGKSTLAAELVRQEGAVLISEDGWLEALFAEEMSSMSDFLRCAGKLRSAMAPHVVALLDAGVSVVLDFQANTVESRRWMRGVIDQSRAQHVLHVLDATDEVCLARLHARNAQGDHPFAVTEEQFHRVTAHFVPPTAEEGFNVVTHTVSG